MSLESVLSLNPWISQLGLAEKMMEWITLGYTADEVVAALRQTDQWKAMFPGIRRDDGSLRMSEAQYLDRSTEYRSLLRQFGRSQQEFDRPQDLAAFFAQEIDPNELRDRLQTYDQIVRSSSDVRDAFYVYAGIKMSDEDLYLMTVYPGERDRWIDQYNKAVAGSSLDYETWITRATEAGMDRVVASLTDLRRQGVVTGDAIDAVRRVSPAFARQITDALFHGQRSDGPFLSLGELMHSFEYAMIGGAAAQAGLGLPTKDRIDALRQAGVDRAKALEGYGFIARESNVLQGALDRMQANRRFTTADFEKAMFLSSPDEQALLDAAQGFDKALGQAGGGPEYRTSRSGRAAAPGLYRVQ